ncbi:MAG: sodium-dependent transporter [Lachnospiraceae bacterium]|nr:sodium-dependent transporter [Lachnospiraceae bacterium]
MNRENFKSRLGFILISAGCAIGIGNVWKFPYVAGQNGGGIFVLFYLLFLITVGVPVLTMEFAVGRASRKSVIGSFKELEKPGHKWHIHGYSALIGNYLLMMFYSTVAGWMLCYFFRFLKGDFVGVTKDVVTAEFNGMLANPWGLTFWTVVIVIGGFLICSLGLQSGVEKISKPMMLGLLGLIVVLAINSILLDGGLEGLKFYLVPDWSKVEQNGLINVMIAALNQSFFTLSLGIGSMAIFGSYMSKDHTLLGESLRISVLDTFVAITSGLIIFPACFAFDVAPDAGPPLIFITLPNVFSEMAGGRFWGSLFFLFMTFASFSTVIAVFENIIACCMDNWNMSRKKASFINCMLMLVLCMPCVLGFNVWSGFQPRGAGSTVLDLEDFIVSNLLLPIGSLIFLLFCTSRWGWGFDKYLEEANTGKGLKMPRFLKGYVTYVIPVMIIVILIMGII